MKNYYIVLTDKKAGWDKIVGRRKTTLEEIDYQAKWIWSLFNKKEKRRYRVLVQGEVRDWRRAFDSELGCSPLNRIYKIAEIGKYAVLEHNKSSHRSDRF